MTLGNNSKGNVFITGVSSGIGLGLAKKYLENGWKVYGISRNPPQEKLDTAHFHFTSIDLSQLSTINEKLDTFIQNISGFELVILNAGIIGRFGDMSTVSIKTMKEVMDVNVWSNKQIIDCFIKNNTLPGQIVAISSGASVSGSRGWNAYGISKAALNMLIKLYAKELADTHCCSLAPALVDTAMQDYLYSLNAGDTYPALERIKGKRNTAEMPTADDAAEKLIAFIEQIKYNVESGEYADIRSL